MKPDDESTGPILRVFEARAKEGRVEELARKLATTSVGVVLHEPGNEGYFFGRGLAGDREVVLFVSVWKDLDAVKKRFGTEWESSFLPPGYSDLIADCSVRHYDLAGGWHVQNLPAG